SPTPDRSAPLQWNQYRPLHQQDDGDESGRVGENARDVEVVEQCADFEPDAIGSPQQLDDEDKLPDERQSCACRSKHAGNELWGATQLQHRFIAMTGRWMLERDYTTWAAVRALGEAVIRTGKVDPQTVRSYLLSDEFQVGVFKGIGL